MASGYPGITAPPIFNGGKQTPPGMLPPVDAPVVPHTAGGVGQHGALATNPHSAPSSTMTPTQVRAMQQFLVNHGFQVAQDGVLGPRTKGAAAAFRQNHKGGAAWSAQHGIGTHPGVVPHGNGGDVGAGGHSGSGSAGAGGSAGVDPNSAFNTLLQQLLAQGGNVGTPFDAKGLGDAAAAPDDALAATLARQAAQNPRQEAQDQADISQWYGLDPNDPNFKLSVLGRLAQARGRDATASSDASSNIGDIAKSLASSIGGSANDGSGQVAAAGANAAGTFGALGEASKQFADDMSPLLAAEAHGAQSKDKATQQQALLALQDQLAQAQGQSTADRANAMAGARSQNNALGQQRFANKGNLLSTLAQMTAADPNSSALTDALTAAKINNTNAKTAQIISGKTGTGHVYKIDMGKAAKSIAVNLGYSGGPTGQAVVPTADHHRLAGQIGAFLRSQGFHPGDGQFKKIGDALFATFVDEHGRPLQPPAAWSI